jgi:hypothetical protein
MELQTTIKKIKADASVFVKDNLELRVTSDDSFTYAGEVLILTKKRLKRIELLRKELTTPINLSLKKINSMFKQESAPFSILENTLKSEMSQYNTKREEELKQHTEVQEAPISKTRTEEGSTSIRKVWKFDVRKLEEVPREFLTIDHVKVNSAIRSGNTDIAGLNVYQEQSISVRT